MGLRKSCFKKKKLSICGVIFLFFLYSFFIKSPPTSSRQSVLEPTVYQAVTKTSSTVTKQRYTLPTRARKSIDQDQSVCRLPELEFKGLHEKAEQSVDCKIKKNWGYIDRDSHVWHFNEDVVEKLEYIDCQYRDILRINDSTYTAGVYKNLSDGTLITNDVIEVRCGGHFRREKSTGMIGVINKLVVGSSLIIFDTVIPLIIPSLLEDKTYEKVNIAKHAESMESKDNTCEPMNIILLSYDSVSRVSWIKRLEKSFYYAMEEMKFDMLEGYNVVGDGTPAALIPIYTGNTEEELPSVVKNDPNARYVDEAYPFIWKDLHKKGYKSLYLDDWPHLAAFSYRMKGFLNHTTHHYFKHYQLRLWQRIGKLYNPRNMKRDDYCVGAIKRHKQLLTLIDDFKHAYESKKNNIVFMHYVENSHDNQDRLNWLDDDLLEFLTRGHQDNTFNNTAIFLFSDHGSRFTDKRSIQRYLEERLPFFSVYLPPWFKEKHKAAYQNLLDNKQKLTSPFDIHATVRHLTCLDPDFDYQTNHSPLKGKERDISLLRPIDKTRSCEDIGVSEHYCSCVKNWQAVDINEKIVSDAAQFSVNSMNQLTHDARTRCLALSLRQILTAEMLDIQNSSKFLLKIEFTVRPSGGVYDVLIHSGNKEQDFKKFEFKSSEFGIRTRNEISRIDAYGDQPSCVADFATNPSDMLDLRKFCFCKPTKNKTKFKQKLNLTKKMKKF